MAEGDALKKLRIQCGQIKAMLTRFKAFLDTVNNKTSVEIINARCEKVETLYKDYMGVQTQIEFLLTEESDIIAAQGKFAVFENEYFEALARGRHYIGDFRRVSAASIPGTSARAEHSTGSSVATGTSQRAFVRLPTITLPTFDGAYEGWLHFRDSFKSIHENANLSEIDKFHYLRASVKNEAHRVIQAFNITSENYELAWNALVKRFEDKQLIIHNHIKALFNLSSISKESCDQLRELHDDAATHLSALRSLGEPVDYWNTLIIYVIANKLDPNSRMEWEEKKAKLKDPTWTVMAEFIVERCRLLKSRCEVQNKNAFSNTKQGAQDAIQKPNTRFKGNTTVHVATNKTLCPCCKGSHLIYTCEHFLKLSALDRLDLIRRLRLCFNCLNSNHHSKECTSGNCRKCNKKHNTLLHVDNSASSRSIVNKEIVNKKAEEAFVEKGISAKCAYRGGPHVVLSTAVVRVQDKIGTLRQCRVLLDSGSQPNFITQNLCDKLDLNSQRVDIPVAGITNLTANIQKQVNVKLKSRLGNFESTLTCLVVRDITDDLPTIQVDKHALNIPSDIQLADPEFDETRGIDMLIGASLFWDLLCVGQIKLLDGHPILQKTRLGWIMGGRLSINLAHSNSTRCNLALETQLHEDIRKFWEIEEVKVKPDILMSGEERECESWFQQTTRRDETGRFVVTIPFKENLKELGNSKEAALRRFKALERKLQRDPELRYQYNDFLQEYLQLGHMGEVSEIDDAKNRSQCYYLPHHAVIKENSLTTRLRVVFDASSKSDTGLSLNDVQKIGPLIQQDLFSIVTRFRKHIYVATADITKMYRQILVADEQTYLQQILWREDPSQEIKNFRLLTVTYGTSAASFLATRCLQEVGLQNKEAFPQASKVILTDFYMDDLLTGGDSIDTIDSITKQVDKLLKEYGFELRKWVTSYRKDGDDIETRSLEAKLGKDGFKTLGLWWNSERDTLRYKVSINHQDKITKRSILSVISQIFDPLGLLNPIIVKAKLVMQCLWKLELGWDETVPPDLYVLWKEFTDRLRYIDEIEIQRCMRTVGNNKMEFHGFCDASEVAYGACVYVKTYNTENATIRLLCARSRVAPLKSLSLPRLELCGALLLAQLMDKIIQALEETNVKRYYWTDSTIVLSWLSQPANKWKTFVANRIAQIQELSNCASWRHISTSENPADLVSRGAYPDQLINHKLWWNGPIWLIQNQNEWPLQKFNVNNSELPEQRVQDSVVLLAISKQIDLFEKYSNLNKLLRVTAYIRRFVYNCKNAYKSRLQGRLFTTELEEALVCLIKIVQEQEFKLELSHFQSAKNLPTKSKVLALNPFVDINGLLRVGGRLQNADMEYGMKHPILLPSKHPFTTLIIRQEHERLMHAGRHAVLNAVRIKYWPVHGIRAVKEVLSRCVKCFKANPINIQPLMGNLPTSRVRPGRPFEICGVDYAGPLLVKDGKTRNRIFVKSYVCIFVCFCTKAVHIELASDMTTESFLNCFRRFISRRGICKEIYSDNGTNFVGAKNQFAELGILLNEIDKNSKFRDLCCNEMIRWHFIPPHTPHFGGLWERAVRSAKRHLRVVLGEARLTFEELGTVLIEIEACLNSRPICPLSEDPNDLRSLTPGHFLIGQSLKALPEPDLLAINENKLDRFQRSQRLYQGFWKRLHYEYLNQLQGRPKWKGDQDSSLSPGTMVIIKEDNTIPMKWPLGRVLTLHPGKDGKVRVATVLTSKGPFMRPVVKLYPLPVDGKP